MKIIKFGFGILPLTTTKNAVIKCKIFSARWNHYATSQLRRVHKWLPTLLSLMELQILLIRASTIRKIRTMLVFFLTHRECSVFANYDAIA